MKISSIKNSAIAEIDLRVDASFYLSDGRLHHSIVNRNPYGNLPLSEVTERIFSGNIFKRLYVKNSDFGYHYLTASDMVKSDIETGKFISKKYTIQYKKLKIEKDWILLSCSGTLGNTAYTTTDYEKFVGTHDLIRIIPATNKIYSGYLYAFLTCKYGYSLLTQSAFGGVVKHIEPHNIENIPIPILPNSTQEKIHDLITEASQYRVKSNKLLKEAVEKIEKFLENNKSIKTLFGKVSLNDINNNYQLRIDAPPFINESIILQKGMKNPEIAFSSIVNLGFKVTRPGIFKRVKVDRNNGIPYIKGSELNRLNPFASCEYLSKSKTPFLEQLKLKVGQILFTCAGTVGDVRLISKEFEDINAIGSQDIIRIEQNKSEISIYYLYAYLKTKFAREYAQALKYGSVIERVEPFHVDLIPVAVPETEIYNQIVEAVSNYNDSMYLAFVKEKTAIDLIEKEIDQWQQ